MERNFGFESKNGFGMKLWTWPELGIGLASVKIQIRLKVCHWVKSKICLKAWYLMKFWHCRHQRHFGYKRFCSQGSSRFSTIGSQGSPMNIVNSKFTDETE